MRIKPKVVRAASALAVQIAAAALVTSCGFVDTGSDPTSPIDSGTGTASSPFDPAPPTPAAPPPPDNSAAPPPPVQNDLSTATVVLDAAQDVSETGGDDLNGARRLFQGFTMPEANGGIAPGWNIVSPLAPKSTRLINSVDGCYVDANGQFQSCYRLDDQLQWPQNYALVPHVIVGQFEPPNLSGPAEYWDSNTWAQYQDYATKTIRYIAVQYRGTGFPVSMFEVGNELDIAGDAKSLWYFDPNNVPPAGDQRRYNAEIALYAVWAKAVDQVAKENPGRQLLIGGPAMGGNSLYFTNGFFHEQFVQAVAAQGLRLDMVTLHFYDDFLNGFFWMTPGASSLPTMGQRIRNALNANGRAGTPIWVTEWGPTADTNMADPWSHINYEGQGAAWAAGFLRTAMASTITGGAILQERDVYGGNATGTPSIPSLTYVQNNIDYPKPYTNVFSMYMLLPGTRKSVALPGAQPDLGGVGSANAASAGLLVYNYNTSVVNGNADLTTNEPVTVGFKNLPFGGTVNVDHYLVDSSHSNVGPYIDAGQTPDPNAVQLQKIETLQGTITNGSLVLPGMTLGQSAVSLWVVNPQ